MIIQQAKLMFFNLICLFLFVFFTHVCDNVFIHGILHFIVFHTFLLNSSCVCICVGVS